MNHNLECIICFFGGFALAMFYDYLRCEWEAKAARRNKGYPSAKPPQRGITITKKK